MRQIGFTRASNSCNSLHSLSVSLRILLHIYEQHRKHQINTLLKIKRNDSSNVNEAIKTFYFYEKILQAQISRNKHKKHKQGTQVEAQKTRINTKDSGKSINKHK